MNKGKASNVSQPVGKAEVLKFGAIEDARSTLRAGNWRREPGSPAASGS
jgi:hypothetical protein